MNALASYALNTAKAKTGLSTGVLLAYVVQAVLAIVACVLLLVAIFFIFADWLAFGATKTSIGMFPYAVIPLSALAGWVHSKPATQRLLGLHDPDWEDDTRRAERL